MPATTRASHFFIKDYNQNIYKLIALSGILLMSNILLVIIIFREDLRVLLVPTHLNKGDIVTVESISEKYLELITHDYIGLILNITPRNYKYAENSILRHTHPSACEAIRRELDKLAMDIKLHNVAISFMVTDMVINKKALRADVTGYLEARAGLEIISRKLRKYYIAYNFTSGRLTLKEFYAAKDKV